MDKEGSRDSSVLFHPFESVEMREEVKQQALFDLVFRDTYNYMLVSLLTLKSINMNNKKKKTFTNQINIFKPYVIDQ